MGNVILNVNESRRKQVMTWKMMTKMMTKIPCPRSFQSISRRLFVRLDALYPIVIWPSTHHLLRLYNNHVLLLQDRLVEVLRPLHSQSLPKVPLLERERELPTTRTTKKIFTANRITVLRNLA